MTPAARTHARTAEFLSIEYETLLFIAKPYILVPSSRRQSAAVTMVWFYCDDCGDTIKKPKLANHFRTCHGQTFTCVDCSRSFNRSSAGSHSTCVSEHEKYALGATKPGGYASTGFFKEGPPQPQQAAAANGSEELVGAQFLSERPPWKCSCCNVNCTSRDTLLGHAAGAKHKRRARAALGLSGQQQQQENGTAAADEQPAETPQAAAADATAAAAAAAGDKRASSESNTAAEETKQPSSKKQKKHKQSKKDKQDTSVEKKDTVTAAAADKVQTEQLQEKESSKKKVKKNQEAAADQQQASEAEAAAVDVLDKDSKKEKKSSDSKQSGKQQQQQQQLPDLAPLLAVAKKKLKKKGKLGFKKLETLLKKNANGGYNEGVVAAVKQQLLAAAEVQLKDDDTLVWQDSN